MTDDLLKYRSEFPILDRTVYLISHSLGAMPRATYDRLHEYADIWATRGVRAWAEGWWDKPVTLGNEVARIIGADANTVVMHQNVSICQSLILSCLFPPKDPKRNKIVFEELNFPSVMYVYEAHASQYGLRIERVESDDGITMPLERMLAAIDEETLLVPISHVLFKSAFLQDAKVITQRAHEVGVFLRHGVADRVRDIARGGAGLDHGFHDAAEKRQEVSLLFELGYLSIEQKAVAEKLYWAVCGTINRMLQKRNPELLPKDLVAMREQLIDQYLCDFSVFQSILDYWAIGQVFPIMPIQRLNEQPSRQAMLVDLTCDSDGKVDRFISPVGVKNALEVHRLVEGESYYLGFFLMGAYQDILGDIHNLFGRVTEVHVYADAEEPDNYFIEKVIKGTTVQEILAVVQYFPNDLQRRMEQLIQQKVKDGLIRPKIGVQLLDQYSKAFHEYTYLGPDFG